MQSKVVKSLAIVMTLALATTAVTATSTDSLAKKKKSPVISKTSLTLKVGSAKKLTLKRAKGTVSWSSSKKEVAKVSSDGVVTAKKEGNATITAKNKGKKYTCKVMVEPDAVPIITPVETYWVCPYCNTNVSSDADYCPHCGHAKLNPVVINPIPTPTVDQCRTNREKLVKYMMTYGTKNGTSYTIKKDLSLNYGSGSVSIVLDNNVLYFRSQGNNMPLKYNMNCYASCDLVVPLTEEIDPRLLGVNFSLTANPNVGYVWYYIDALPGLDYNEAYVTRKPVYMSDIKSSSNIRWYVSRNDYPAVFTQADIEAYANSFVSMIYLGGNRLLTDSGLGITMADLGFSAN